MQQGLFTKLYSSVNRLFTQQDILFVKVSSAIEKVLFMTHNITVNNDYLMMTFMVKNTKVVCIKSPNGETLCDTILFGDEAIILIIVPDRIVFNDYDPDKRMRIVHSIYEYICLHLVEVFSPRQGSSLLHILSLAPEVLTFNTLNAIGHLYDTTNIYCIGDSNISETKLNDILSHSINDLLDCGGILSM